MFGQRRAVEIGGLIWESLLLLRLLLPRLPPTEMRQDVDSTRPTLKYMDLTGSDGSAVPAHQGPAHRLSDRSDWTEVRNGCNAIGQEAPVLARLVGGWSRAWCQVNRPYTPKGFYWCL